MMVPLPFAERMRKGDPGDPLLAQVLPHADEQLATEGWVADPVGDQASRQARGVLHKYAGRVRLVSTGACAIHCRYCFRQQFDYAGEHAGAGQWRAAVDYISGRDDIEEVILSGGDPLMLPTRQLKSLTEQLRSLPRIRRLRLHTRLPVVLPDRVTDSLANWIEGLPWPVVVVIHANHAAEFDADVDAAMARLRGTGAHLLNQSVLLRGINDSADALEALMQRSFEAGVIPYYLHMLDRVAGAMRYDVDRRQALDLLETLRIRLAGYLVPRLVREEAGAPYKLPVL